MNKPHDQHASTHQDKNVKPQPVDSHHQVLSELGGAGAPSTVDPTDEILRQDLESDMGEAPSFDKAHSGEEEIVEPGLGDSIEALKAQRVAAEEKAEQYLDHLKRIQAEIENSRHRMEREIDKARKFALEKFVGDLLPVADSLERGFAEILANNGSLESLQKGTELTLNMLIKVLDKNKVTQLDPVGEIFNPELHEAMSIVPVPDAKPNTVHQVLQKGYLLSGRLVRPAMVIVTKA